MERLKIDDYFLQIARLVSLRATCRRRTVGCVLVDGQNRIVATGYNGGLPHEVHCLDVPCVGACDPHGDTTRCLAVHAELNALMQCGRREQVTTVYCTDSPCLACARLLCQLPRLRCVVYVRFYKQDGIEQLKSRNLQTVQLPNAYDRAATADLFERYERTRNASQSGSDVPKAQSTNPGAP